MGCTSGAVRVKAGRVLHFRSLDWGMDALRKVIVHIDFIKNEEVIVRLFGVPVQRHVLGNYNLGSKSSAQNLWINQAILTTNW